MTAPVPATLAAEARRVVRVEAHDPLWVRGLLHDAADALDEQAARITQLEAALREIAEKPKYRFRGRTLDVLDLQQIARAALSATTGGTTHE